MIDLAIIWQNMDVNRNEITPEFRSIVSIVSIVSIAADIVAFHQIHILNFYQAGLQTEELQTEAP